MSVPTSTVTRTTHTRTVLTAKLTVVKQFEEEIGTGLFTPFSLAAFLGKRLNHFTTKQEEEDFMLRQKYGLEEPVLTDKERRAISLEEAKLSRGGRR
jgi:hypothetical protein